MSTTNTEPNIDIIFKSLGVSAIKRGESGYCALVLKDDTDKTRDIITFKSIEDLDDDEVAKWTPENIVKIKDVLEGTPNMLYVARLDSTYVAPALTDFTLTSTNTDVAVGQEVQLSLINPVPSGAVIGPATYVSDDDTTGTVDASGKVHGVKDGSVKITVTETASGISKYITINVTATSPTSEDKPVPLNVVQNATGSAGLMTLLKTLAGQIPRNCWISLGDNTNTQDVSDLVSWVKSKNQNDRTRYKAFVYKATSPDDQHVVNYTNSNIVFADDRGKQTGDVAVPYLLGMLTGMSINMSSTALELKKFISVEEPDDITSAIQNGEFVLKNDEGVVKVAQDVNSLVTIGEGISLSYTDINVTEKMDLIYTDIYKAIKDDYQSKYSNTYQYQNLLISALMGYLGLIALDNIIDPNYDNKFEINLDKQRLANYAHYAKEVVDTWDDDKVRQMTVGKQVFLKADIKIVEIMKDFDIIIYTN